MSESLAAATASYFTQHFGDQPLHIFLSPGRINIIGEHVDYNDGFVLPGAIDKYVCLAITAIAGTTSVILAKDIEEKFEFDITDPIQPVAQQWVNYFLGILKLLQEAGHQLKAFRVAFAGNIPIGAGLSSSAAVECGFAYALNELFSYGLSKKEIALMGQKAENTFVGVQCGIMDQFASVFGKQGHVLRLDCNTLDYDYHAANFADYALLLINSNVKHTLLTSAYNTRRQETADGLALVKKHFPEVKTYRDVHSEHLSQVRAEAGDIIFRRSQFVIDEIARVGMAVQALEQNDLKKLGALMFETHRGLSEEYEVSCAETDFLVNAVKNDPRVLGARMMGGGFGGCTINLVERSYEDELVAKISEQYKTAFNIIPEAYKVTLSEGTHEVAKT